MPTSRSTSTTGWTTTEPSRRFESIVAEHEGRPHWGKLHTLDADRLHALYPRFDDFRAVRDRLDPGRLFANDYLHRVLGD